MFRREERLMKCPQRETLLADPLDVKYSKIFYSPSGWSLTSLRPECSSLVLPVWLIALSRDLETIFHCLAQQKTFWTNSKFCQAWTNAVLVVLWSQLALIVWPLLQKQRAAFTLEVEGGESVTYSQTLLQQSTRAWKCWCWNMSAPHNPTYFFSLPAVHHTLPPTHFRSSHLSWQPVGLISKHLIG